MTSGHKHVWREIPDSNLSAYAAKCQCDCGLVSVFKCANDAYDQRICLITANELVVSRLLGLLHSSGVNVNPYRVTLETVSPYRKLCVVLELIPAIWRVSPEYDSGIWPNWLYHFDRWIGRLDGNAPGNLLLTPEKTIVPIDWGLSFTWTTERHTRPVDSLDVPCHTRVAGVSDDTVIDVIQAIPEVTLWNTIMIPELTDDLIPVGVLVSYFSGLLLRRKLLGAGKRNAQA